MIIRNETTHSILAENARCATTLLSRAIGLLGRSELRGFDALILPSCKAVHMWGMRFAIDVVFFTADYKVVHLIEDLRPWRCSPYIRTASGVIEFASGTLQITPTHIGDQLRLEP